MADRDGANAERTLHEEWLASDPPRDPHPYQLALSTVEPGDPCPRDDCDGVVEEGEFQGKVFRTCTARRCPLFLEAERAATIVEHRSEPVFPK